MSFQRAIARGVALGAAALTLPLWPAPARAEWPRGGVQVYPTSDGSTPLIAADGTAGLYVAWVDVSRTIRVQRVSANGEISPGWSQGGVPLGDGTSLQGDPVLLPSGSGELLVARSQTAGGVEYDIYLQKLAADGSVAPGWPENGLAVCTLPGSQQVEAVVSDGSGGAIVAWTDRSDGVRPRVYLQRATSSGSVAWPADGVPASAVDSVQTDFRMIPDGDGGAIVAWGQMDQFQPVVLARRIAADGQTAAGWPEEGLAVLGGDHGYLRDMVSDGEHGALILVGAAKHFVQHLTGDGQVAEGWSPRGTLVSHRPTPLLSAAMIGDGSGGVIVAWWGAPGAMFAQRIAADDGNRTWGTEGVTFSPVSIGTAPVLVPDERGGAIMGWLDRRGGGDPYLLRVDAGGHTAGGWPNAGVPADESGEAWYAIAMAEDGASGAYVAWESRASGAIRVQRVGAAGGVGELWGMGPSAPFDIVGPWPNPTAAGARIVFHLDRPEPVWAEVFDLAGRRVRALVEGEILSAGFHDASWDGLDQSGREPRPGILFLRVWAGESILSRRIVRIR